MSITNRPSRRGFTLVEAMIASVVLATCAVGICGVLIACAHSSDEIDAQTACVEAARLNVESLVAKRLANLSPADGSTGVETIADADMITADSITDAEQARQAMSYKTVTPRTVTSAGQLRYVSRSGVQSTRDIAVISVTSTGENGQTVTLRQLVTRAEVRK